jgi:4-hydroxybutyrate dehydrogenase
MASACVMGKMKASGKCSKPCYLAGSYKVLLLLADHGRISNNWRNKPPLPLVKLPKLAPFPKFQNAQSGMISAFSFPTNIRFGAGALAELPQQLTKFGMQKPLVVTDPGLISTAAFKSLETVSNKQWPVFSGVHPNPMIEDVEAATKAYQENKCDSVIAFGGGSALDVGKVIRISIKRPAQPLFPFDSQADWSGLVPCITIPTTSGTGSEVGRSSVIIKDGRKQVIFHPALLASQVILDPELTRGLPPRLTAATGVDALVHCIESFTSPVFHPMCDGIALEGINLINQSLVRAVKNGNDIDARGKMQVAAMMGAVAFQKDLGAIHSLAHPLSTFCGLHHGTANALCTPFVMKFNAARVPGLYRRVGIALGLNNPDDEATINCVSNLLCEIGLAPGLHAHGVKESQLDPMSEQAFEDSCHQTNPVPVTRADLRHLYQLAL